MKLIEIENLVYMVEPILKKAEGVVGLKLARNIQMCEEELKYYLNEKRRLFEKYGETKGDQIVIEPGSENAKKYEEEIKPCMNIDVEMNFRTITDDELMASNLTGNEIKLIIQYFGEKL